MSRNSFSTFLSLFLIGAAAVLGSARAHAVLFVDDFTGNGNPNTGNVNFNLLNRQAGGTLVPIPYAAVGNTQIGNPTLRLPGDGNYQLLAFSGNVSPQQNFNAARSAGGMTISFDVDPEINPNTDNWTAINLGLSQADRHSFIAGGASHFGVLFRGDGRIQTFDGGAAIDSTSIWAPGGNRGGQNDFTKVSLKITDPTDGNPFDGVGQTKFEIFSSLVNGGTTAISTFTKGGGGYSQNFMNLSSINIGGVDNLSIDSGAKLVRIPGLFNTGVDNNGNPLPNSINSQDPHYVITNNANGVEPFVPHVHDESIFPIVAGPWVANSATSKWIAPQFNTGSAAGAVGADGNYDYQMVFDLTGMDPTTAQISGLWATDNAGLDILINGISTGQSTGEAQFNVLTPFFIGSGFQSGLNTLTFRLNNSAVGFTALRVENIFGTAAPAVPEPMTAGMLAIGALALLRRRRSLQAA